MSLTDADNQRYFDALQSREKHCAAWLKEQSKTVRNTVRYSALFGLLNGVGIIVQAAIFAYLLQAVIIDKTPWDLLLKPVLILLILLLFRSVCTYYQQVCGFEAGAYVKKHIREQLLMKLARLGQHYLKQNNSGELSRLTLEQVDGLEHYVSRYLPQHYIVGILPLLTIAVVLPINWVVGIIFLVTGPLVPIFMILIGMGAASAQRNQFLAMKRMSGYYLDRVQGLATLKSFGQAWHEVQTVGDMAADFREKTMAVLRIAFLSSAVLEFFSALAVALVAVYVGLGLLGQIHFGPAQQISLGEALFVLLLAPEFFMPLRQLAAFYHDKAAAIGAADAILGLFEQPEPVSTKPESCSQFKISSSEPLIEFRSVYKSYDTRQVLTNIQLSIQAGEKIALVGASGAGKSTLINLMLGLEEPNTGQIRLYGQAVSQERAAACIAWISQTPYLFYGTIADNIALAKQGASAEEILQAAEAANVLSFSDKLPQGLQTVVGERGFGLSGGQVQRIALARAFLKNTPIIVLDEPSAHLDHQAKVQFMNTLERLFADKTVLIASHDAVVIGRMQRQCQLKQGQLIR